MRNLRTAFGLLTTLPFGMPESWLPGDSGRAGIWYPLVGVVVGGLTWLCWIALNLYFPPLVAGVLTVVTWVSLTGGLHLDGLADCCDGLLSSNTSLRRLEIMKDPHLGTFGGIGLLLLLFAKVTALSLLAPSAGFGIILAATISRWLILPASLLPLANPGGMGADFAAGFRQSAIFITAILPLGLALLLGMEGLWAVFAALIAAAAVLGLACQRIHGVTGDVFGMLVEVTETGVLLSFTFGVK
ncbi:MAG: adenosylcobinamide-GDP ribazoletransferase [Deltaproteobacteria bacterium HGW-Deltaproteobacteria-6]|jgi:adenosylcobinamide-GDP ribazoletransferase|nr:MAG: adenosylcobinamide-GDP ribazoletransferase [Deltaproteobacteria bacterium HGW-Deltaproteobacteria-6]